MPIKVIINISSFAKVIIYIVVKHYSFLDLIVRNKKLTIYLKFMIIAILFFWY